jgi:hypothetical protein
MTARYRQQALADLAKEPVPSEVLAAYKQDAMMFGKDYNPKTI